MYKHFYKHNILNMKTSRLLLFAFLLISIVSQSQTSFYGMTSKGGSGREGTIFKTDSTGSNLQTVFNFKYHHPGRNPKSIFTQASNGKIYGTTKFGGTHLCSFPYYQYQRYSGVMFEYDPSNNNYNVLFNFNDTITGCWPESAPILASNGKLYGVTPGIGGFSQHYGTVYSYDLATGTYTKIHSFGQGSSDGENPVGNLLIAADGKLYGITSDGGFNDKGIIFTIDPTTDTYTKKLDLQNGWYGNKAAQGAKAGLIQASNGIMYGTSEEGGNYPNGYQYAYGNIFKYDPTTNVATNLYGFSNDSLGKNPEGAPVMIGTNELFCITHKYYQVPGTYNQKPHYYLWKYTISTGTAIVVDSIANGMFNDKLIVNTNGEIIITGKDYNISSALRFWKFNPSSNTRSLMDTTINVGYLYKGLMLASNGKYYSGAAYYSDPSQPTSTDGSFIEYDVTNHMIAEKFKFSEPIDGINPEGDLLMATNGKLYGTTTKGGTYNKGVIFEYNAADNTYTKRFDLDSLSGYDPKDGLMEASNGNFYLLTYMGGTTGDGTLIEIDTSNWSMTTQVNFNSTLGRKPMGKVIEAWDGKLYGLTAYDGGGLFQYNISTGSAVKKYSFTTSSGTYPSASLMLANNGKLYGLTSYDGSSSYSHGTFFEYDPIANTLTVKKQMFQYLGYRSVGNTPIQATNGNMYMPITASGGSNGDYDGGTIDSYNGTSFSNEAVFSVNNTGSKPMGDLMESANGEFYGYTFTGGANNYGTIFKFDANTSTITKTIDFNQSNGANPIRGSLTEVGLSNISISQQPTISTTCIGDNAIISINATHTTLLHYQWYKNGIRISGATNDTLNFSALSLSDVGTYYCKVTGGARAIISNNITISPTAKPTVVIGSLASSYCINNVDINLTATPSGGSFSGTGVSGSIFSPSNAGVGNTDVIYTYTDATGCSNKDTANIIINALPDASFSGYNSTYCDNSLPSTLVPTTTGGTFSGSGVIGTTFDPSFYAGGSGIMLFSKIKYEITDVNSCTNTDSVTVTITHAPHVNINGLDSIYCANANIDTLVVSPIGGSITAGAFLNGNIFNPANASIGYNNIYYSYTNSNNCTNADTLKIRINASPDASFTGLATEYCNNDNADTLIVATIGGSFLGNTNGAIFDPKLIAIPTNVISVQKSITYTITNNEGCTDSTTNTTTIFPIPIVNFGSLVSSICHNGFPILLTSGTPSGGVYSGNGVQGISFVPTNAPLGNDTLIYSYTNTNSCSNYDTAIIEILPAPEFTLGNDTDICINNFITFTTKLGNGYVFLWSDGSTDSSLTIDASTLGTGNYTYSVTVTDQYNNCVETDDIQLTINACTGINSTENADLKTSVYPNPSTGIFNINSRNSFEKLEIYSADGRLIFTQDVKNIDSHFQINLKGQSKGIYYLLLYSGKTIEHKQLILK